MKYINQSLILILVFTASFSSGMQLVNRVTQELRKNSALVNAFKNRLQFRRNFNIGKIAKTNYFTNSKAISIGFQTPKRCISTQDIKTMFNEFNYCVDQTIKIGLSEKHSYKPNELNNYLNKYLYELNPNNTCEYISYPAVDEYSEVMTFSRNDLYYKNRLSYLDLIFCNQDLLKHDYAKFLLYRAIQYKDYKMVMILLKLGLNPFQEITIKETKHRLIDFVDTKLKLLLQLMTEKNQISQD